MITRACSYRMATCNNAKFPAPMLTTLRCQTSTIEKCVLPLFVLRIPVVCIVVTHTNVYCTTSLRPPFVFFVILWYFLRTPFVSTRTNLRKHNGLGSEHKRGRTAYCDSGTIPHAKLGRVGIIVLYTRALTCAKRYRRTRWHP